MKNLTYLGLLSVPFCLGQHAHAQSSPHPDTQPQQKPNIIFILADDMGYGDVSAYNKDSHIQTRHIDQMAPLGLWQFDATLQLNGGGRMPDPYELSDGSLSWERRYGSFQQLSAQVTRYFRRWSVYIGGENLTNFKQKNPIIDASNPWGENFDATMVWGPMHGAKAYIGLRFNLARN